MMHCKSIYKNSDEYHAYFMAELKEGWQRDRIVSLTRELSEAAAPENQKLISGIEEKILKEERTVIRIEGLESAVLALAKEKVRLGRLDAQAVMDYRAEISDIVYDRWCKLQELLETDDDELTAGLLVVSHCLIISEEKQARLAPLREWSEKLGVAFETDIFDNDAQTEQVSEPASST